MLGVYVHFPYCRSLCPYCNFNSHAVAEIPHGAYADAIIAELETRLRDHDARGRGLRSVYFGGGTPGLWRPDDLGRVLEAIDGRLPLDRDAEVTVEVNPGSVDVTALPALRDAGATRLSLGVQSLRDRHLFRLGRLHSADDALRALERALGLGFASVSIDFMFALPGQDLAEWQADLDALVGLGAPHVSLYSLTVEEGTPLHDWVARRQVALPDEDVEATMFEETRDRLVAAGFEHYEVSNFARPGHRAIHNALYWLGGEWLGLGAGAHGFLRLREGDARRADAPADALGLRWADVDDPLEYMRSALSGERPEAFHEWRDRAGLVREEIMTGLRWLDGLDLGALGERNGYDVDGAFGEVVRGLERDGLADRRGAELVLTADGLLLLNRVAQRFFDARG